MTEISHTETFQAVLFDLDGTLLPMDQDIFVKDYFSRLAAKVAPRGYEPGKLVESIWKCTGAMMKNDGRQTNEKVFWEAFSGIYGEKALQDIGLFEDFYKNEFQKSQSVCGKNEKAVRIVEELKASGARVILATNPIFPSIATESRIRWAGFEPSDFEFYTTYENSYFSKPNPLYFQEICEKRNLNPSKCLMIGNDAREDTAAGKIGMKVFLVTDCLINRENADLSAYPQGSFEDLEKYLSQMSMFSTSAKKPE